jgi:hypothetical protein
MWIVLNDAFLSVVKHRNPNMLLVRARKEADLEAIFPSAKITHTPQRDYQYRCVVSREAVKKALAFEVDRIDYDNFKNSVEDNERHDAYSAIWSTMFSWARGGFERKPEPWKARRTDALTGLPLAGHHPAFGSAAEEAAEKAAIADDLATRFQAQEKQREKP